jgi:hypothetical protein
MKIAEVFGYGIDDHSAEAWAARNSKTCPFRNSPCTKVSKIDPLGICSFSDGKTAAVVCPNRFLDKNKIFRDAGRLAFGDAVTIGIFPEVRILKIKGKGGKSDKKIGKVDFLLGKIADGLVVDFAALEVQAVYISGTTVRPNFDEFISTQGPSNSYIPDEKRPDFRSSAQKRLVPQLQLKVPVFRRWGKKFFVVVDSQFFNALPKFSTTSRSNSELTWLCYPFDNTGVTYEMNDPEIVFSEWDDVANALREGTPPEPEEILNELQLKLDNKKKPLSVFET